MVAFLLDDLLQSIGNLKDSTFEEALVAEPVRDWLPRLR